MKSSSLYLRVGMLVLAGLALAVGFILYLTSGRLGPGGRTFEAYFSESVTGLDVGAPVRVRGVQIGRVTEIALAGSAYLNQYKGQGTSRDGLGLVLVRFIVDGARYADADPDEMVRRGLRVRLSSQGLTGVTYLEMDFSNTPDRFPEAAHFWTPDYPVIPSVPSTVTQVTTAAEQLVARLSTLDLEKLVNDFTALIGGLRGEIDGGNLAVTLRETAATMTAVRKAVEGAELEEMAAQARTTLASLNEAVQAVQQLVADGQVKQAVANGGQAMAELRTTIAQLPPVIQSLDRTVRAARNATGDLQGDLTPVIRDLRATIANLRDTTEALRANPSQALFGNPPPRPATAR